MNTRIRFFLSIYVLLVSLSCFGQYQLVKTYPVDKPYLMAADPTGNAYVVNGNQLWMYNRSDTLFRKFSNIRLGELTSIDATNPMKILLYFQDQGRIQFLDNNISEFMEPISLEAYELEQATVACTSYDNGFWVFTPTNFSMVRFDQFFQTTTQIRNIHQLIDAPEINPTWMQESSNQLYLYDPEIGVMVFDVFGGYVKTIPVSGADYFQVIEGKLVYPQDDALYSFDLKTFNEEKWAWPMKKAPQYAWLTYDKLYLLTDKSLMIYKAQ